MNRNGMIFVLALMLAGCGHAAAVVPPEVTFNNIQWDRLTDDNTLTHGKLDVVIERLAELQSALDSRVPAPQPTPVEPEPVAAEIAQLPESPTAPAAPPGVAAVLPSPPAVESVAEVAAKPRAVLYVANFYCPPCEAFQASMHRLPFAIEKIVAADSPTHLFPCLVFPDDTSSTGWRMHSGSVAALERYLSPAAPVSVANVRTVLVNGESLNLDAFLASYYRGRWTHPGTVQEHLLEHGVDPADLAVLTNEQMERLHSALHEREQGTRPMSRRVVSQPARVQTQPVYYASGCPGGNCPTGVFVRRWR